MDYKEILELLRSIQSVEDYQEKKEALFKNIEQFASANLETLRKLQSSELSQDEIKMEFAKFQHDWVTMGNELEPEFNRLDTIRGISQMADSIEKEFLKHIEPMAKEGEQLMNKLMVGASGGPPMPPPGGYPPPGYGASPIVIKQIERQKIDELDALYKIKSIDELKNSKDLIFDAIEKKQQNYLQQLKSFDIRNVPQDEFLQILDQQDILYNELECEYKRLEDLPGGREYIEIFIEELKKHLINTEKNTDGLIEQMYSYNPGLRTYPPPGNYPPPPPPRKNIERQKLEEFEILYGMKSIEELKDSMDLVFDSLGTSLKDTLQKLRSLKDKPREENMAEYQELKRYLEVFENEVKSEIERLEALPGGVEYIETFYTEVENRLGPILNEIEQLKDELGL